MHLSAICRFSSFSWKSFHIENLVFLFSTFLCHHFHQVFFQIKWPTQQKTKTTWRKSFSKVENSRLNNWSWMQTDSDSTSTLELLFSLKNKILPNHKVRWILKNCALNSKWRPTQLRTKQRCWSSSEHFQML